MAKFLPVPCISLAVARSSTNCRTLLLYVQVMNFDQRHCYQQPSPQSCATFIQVGGWTAFIIYTAVARMRIRAAVRCALHCSPMHECCLRATHVPSGRL
jgi:hypothetical protein